MSGINSMDDFLRVSEKNRPRYYKVHGGLYREFWGEVCDDERQLILSGCVEEDFKKTARRATGEEVTE